MIVWCDEDLTQGPLHADFKLSKDGEGVYLYGAGMTTPILVDSVLVPALPTDHSYARFPNGGEQLGISSMPTPNDGNVAPSFDLLTTGFVPDEVVIDAVGATPQSTVAYVYSTAPGSWVVTGGTPCDGLGLQLAPPVLIASYETADDFGNAQAIVPEEVLLGPIYVQAVDVATCSASSVVELIP